MNNEEAIDKIMAKSRSRELKIDYSNKYGRLTPIKECRYIDKSGKEYRGLECECECGNKKLIKLSEVMYGRTRSCGCLAKENLAGVRIKHGYTIGYYQTDEKINPTFQAWAAAKTRAKQTDVSFAWDDFADFLIDMGDKPEDKDMLLRRDVLLDFTKENCFWATSAEFGDVIRNKRNQWKKDAMDKNGMTYSALNQRLANGWTQEEIEAWTPDDRGKHIDSLRHPISKYKEEADKIEDRNERIYFYRSKGCSLTDMGKEFGITRERCRQIYNKLKKQYE